MTKTLLRKRKSKKAATALVKKRSIRLIMHTRVCAKSRNGNYQLENVWKTSYTSSLRNVCSISKLLCHFVLDK
jgi:hypothetical protein